jgi:hypothetical protein
MFVCLFVCLALLSYHHCDGYSAQSSGSLTYMGPAGGMTGAAQTMAAMPQFYSAPMPTDQAGFMPIPIYNMQGTVNACTILTVQYWQY